MKTVFSTTCLALASMLILSVPLNAIALESVTGKVILTISGKVEAKNSDKGAEFDLAMLERLPQQTFTTMTPWSKQPIKFTGPLLRDVLAAARASGTVLNASALNDFQTSIPMGDARKFDVIIAHHMNGEIISVKTKGPLFIVYPYDSKVELRSVIYYERSVWQLKSLIVK